MATIIWPLCGVKLLKNGRDKLVVRSPEKAGVGGSTPSLATISIIISITYSASLTYYILSV
jgi:hypothetical protein